MQVILDSSFARPGSAPVWGGKKGEFRDWTSLILGQIPHSTELNASQMPGDCLAGGGGGGGMGGFGTLIV